MLGDAMTSDYLPRPYIGPWLCSERSYLLDEIDAVIDAIDKREPRVQAWCDNEPLPAKRARLTAALEAVPSSQPLCGLLVGVKDIVTSAELPTRCGSALPAEAFPGGDAAAVAISQAVPKPTQSGGGRVPARKPCSCPPPRSITRADTHANQRSHRGSEPKDQWHHQELNPGTNTVSSERLFAISTNNSSEA